MSIPPVVMAQPDAEAWVWASLRHLPGVTCWCYAAAQLDPPWLWAVSVQVDARARTKKAARDLAEQARLIMAALPAAAWEDGSVADAEPVEGPFWLPDDDGAPRYTARYELRVHPRRAAAPPPIGGTAAAGLPGRKQR